MVKKDFVAIKTAKPNFFYGYIVVAAGFGVWFIGFTLQNSFSVFFLPVSQDFGWTHAQTSFAASLYGILLGFLALGMGWLTDKLGPRFVVTIFGYFVVMSKLPFVMAEAITSMSVPPILVLVMIVLVLFILGCFLPVIPLPLITTPIFVPIAKSMGWDLVWFGVIMVLMMNMACITPPFGINLFVMKGVTQKPISLIYSSAMPFVLALTVTVVLIIAFPALSIWLPYLLH